MALTLDDSIQEEVFFEIQAAVTVVLGKAVASLALIQWCLLDDRNLGYCFIMNIKTDCTKYD